MRGRTWIFVVGVGASLLLAVSSQAPATATPSPNFVVIVTDDQRWDTIGRCLPALDGLDLAAGADSCMPNLQADLIANGMTFLKGEVSESLCCPSRASILTGQYAAHTNVDSNGDFDAFDDTSTLATWLHDAGYRTGMFGKYLNGYPGNFGSGYVPPGWDSFHGFHDFVADGAYSDYPWIDWDAGAGAPVISSYLDANSTTEDACAPGNFYSTDLICHQGLGFLTSDVVQPFFIYLAPAAPHLPAIAAERHKNLYSNVAAPQYPDYNTVPMPNPPSYMPTSPLSQTKLNALAASFRAQLRTNRAVDDMVGAIYDQLAADGRLENTVFVFISDNGLAIGEKRHTAKQCGFLVCHRVPFVILCPPSICPGAQPGSVDPDNYALNIDIAPTIAAMAGVTPDLRVDGQSLVPILESPGSPWRSEWMFNETNPVIHGVVAAESDGNTYKYFRTLTAETVLFDLTSDPWEQVNLVGDGVHTSIENSMAARLADSISNPLVVIDSAPPPFTAQTSVNFAFSANETVVFDCVLDSAAAELCGSGMAGTIDYTGIGEGQHVFRLTALDGWNNTTTLLKVFTVDLTNPAPPTLTATPPATSGPSVSFSFSDSESGLTHLCTLDSVETSCVSPQAYSGLTEGTHTFSVKSVDGAGNISDPASYTWTVVPGGTSLTVTITKPTVDQLNTSTAVSVKWTGASTITNYQVFERVGVSGTPVMVQSSRLKSFARTGVPGTTYCYVVMGFDNAGNSGSSDLTCLAIPADDRDPAMSYLGDVAQTTAAGTYMGTLTVLDGAGEEAILTFSGRKIGLLLQKNPASGKVQIWLDGVLNVVIDLYSTSTSNLKYTWTVSVPDGVHTVRIVWTGTKRSQSTGTAISIDGFAFIGG